MRLGLMEIGIDLLLALESAIVLCAPSHVTNALLASSQLQRYINYEANDHKLAVLTCYSSTKSPYP